MKQNIPIDIYESKHQDLNPKSAMWDCLEKNYKLYTFPESGVQIIPPQIANIDPVTGDVSIGKEE